MREGRIINLRSHLPDANPRYVSTKDATYAPEIAKQDNRAPSRVSMGDSLHTERNWRTAIPLRPGALDHERFGSMQADGAVKPFTPSLSVLVSTSLGRFIA